MRPSIASPVICLVVCVVVGNMVMTTGCRPKNRRYTLRGQVMRKNAATTQVTVNGDEVPGFMAAMTMPYKVHDPGQLQKVEAGDMISADLIVTSDENDYWLENIRVLDSSRRKP